jgi:hypothetical protein
MIDIRNYDNSYWLRMTLKILGMVGSSQENVINKIDIDLNSLQGSEIVRKEERGTHIERVKVTRGGKTFYREQRVGRKPSRKDTGKIASLPEDIKKEILELRRIGDSGMKIKEIIEESIEHEIESVTLSSIDRQKVDDIDNQIVDITQNIRSESNPTKIKDLKIKRDKLLLEGRKLAPTKEVTYIHGKSTDRNFVEEGLIDKDGKLKITGQSLVDWAKARGVESKKKRKTVSEVEARSKEELDRQFKEANEKLARLKVKNQELVSRITAERKSKAESDKIRSQLRNENLALREKLKALEAK